MKRILLLILLSAHLLFSNIQDSFPQLTSRVVDNANILSEDTKANLETILENHEKETSNQIVVVSINNLESYSIENYANELFRHWKLGHKDNNNGVLLLISKEDRKLRIEVGYGLEGALTDKISHEIIEYIIKPNFKQEYYNKGVEEAVDNIIEAIKGEYINSNPNVDGNTDKIESYAPLFFFAIMFLSSIVNGVSKSIKLKKLYKITKSSQVSSFIATSIFVFASGFITFPLLLASIAFIIIFIIIYIQIGVVDFEKIKHNAKNTSSSSGGYGGGFSSGGGFSGGGGSSGGGGASGGW